MAKASGSFTFIWQGGEPTLMGLDFFEWAVALQKRHGAGIRVENALQTNGTLVDENWARFFKRNNFLVGISLDGPRHVHDHSRRNAVGVGSWEKVDAGFRMLLKTGVMVNAVSCVTDFSSQYAREVYEYLKQAGATYLQFIPIVEPLTQENGKRGVADYSISPEAYGNYLCTLFDLWHEDFVDGRPTTSIRYFETLFFMLLGHPAPECGSGKECGQYLAVEHNGDVYPCDFFVEPAHKLGTIQEHDPHDLFNSKRQRQFGGAKANLQPVCRSCKWLKLCHGGCLKDRRHNPASFKMNYFCKSLKMFLPHAVPVMRELAKQWRG